MKHAFGWGGKRHIILDVDMKKRQQIIITVGITLFILMGLFPPWKYTLSAPSLYRERPAGYALIFFSPKPEKNAEAYGVKIDISRLVIQWIVLIAVIGFGIFIMKDGQQAHSQENNINDR
jgi:uncharacterized membrane protein SpoIIM required for sporulation